MQPLLLRDPNFILVPVVATPTSDGSLNLKQECVVSKPRAYGPILAATFTLVKRRKLQTVGLYAIPKTQDPPMTVEALLRLPPDTLKSTTKLVDSFAEQAETLELTLAPGDWVAYVVGLFEEDESGH